MVAPPQTQTDNNSPSPLSTPSTSSHPQATENQDPHDCTARSATEAAPPIIASDVAFFDCPPQNQEQDTDRGQGLYAVQYASHLGMSPDYSSTTLIPLKYKIPTRSNTAGEESGQGGEAVRRPNGAAQRRVVVRRFVIAFQLDLGLLFKLAFGVVLFSQDGSRQRTIILILIATLVYLYQTGALAPLVRYARRVLTPPPPVAAHQQNPAARQNDANDQQQPAENNAAVDGNEIDPVRGGDQQAAPAGGRNNEGMNLVGIAREIQTFIVGFIASLLPGFEHPHND